MLATPNTHTHSAPLRHSSLWERVAAAEHTAPTKRERTSQARAATLERATANKREAKVTAAERLTAKEYDRADAAWADPTRAPHPALDLAPHSLHDTLLLHEATVLVNLHSQAVGVQNIRTLVPILEPSSSQYTK